MTNFLLFGIQGSTHASHVVRSPRLKTEEKETDHFYVIGKINLIHVVVAADNEDIAVFNYIVEGNYI